MHTILARLIISGNIIWSFSASQNCCFNSYVKYSYFKKMIIDLFVLLLLLLLALLVLVFLISYTNELLNIKFDQNILYKFINWMLQNSGVGNNL